MHSALSQLKLARLLSLFSLGIAYEKNECWWVRIKRAATHKNIWERFMQLKKKKIAINTWWISSQIISSISSNLDKTSQLANSIIKLWKWKWWDLAKAKRLKNFSKINLACHFSSSPCQCFSQQPVPPQSTTISTTQQHPSQSSSLSRSKTTTDRTTSGMRLEMASAPLNMGTWRMPELRTEKFKSPRATTATSPQRVSRSKSITKLMKTASKRQALTSQHHHPSRKKSLTSGPRSTHNHNITSKTTISSNTTTNNTKLS